MDTEPVEISAKCEVLIKTEYAGARTTRLFCGRPTVKAYPAKGGGFMALCWEHGQKHTEAWPLQEIDHVLV